MNENAWDVSGRYATCKRYLQWLGLWDCDLRGTPVQELPLHDLELLVTCFMDNDLEAIAQQQKAAGWIPPTD